MVSKAEGSEPTDFMSKIAREGFQSGDVYDRSRPSYVDTVVKFVIEKLEWNRPAEGVLCDVLELGAGTGKFTRCLRQIAGNNLRLRASDPNPYFLRTIKESVKGVEILENAAQHIELPDNSVKSVVAATAFNWFATVEALQEIHRVLTPGGALVLVWNIRDESVPWVHAVLELLRSHEKELDNYVGTTTEDWKECFQDFQGFSCLQQRIFSGPSLEGDIEFILANIMSISYLASRDPDSQLQTREKFRHVIHKYVDEKDEKHMRLPFISKVCWCQKI